MAIVYPSGVTDAKAKLAFCYAAQEKLRQKHNVVGKWYKEGTIDSKEFDALPTAWKTTLSTASKEGKITETDWETFVKDVYPVLEGVVIAALCDAKAAVMKDAAAVAAVDLDALSG